MHHKAPLSKEVCLKLKWMHNQKVMRRAEVNKAVDALPKKWQVWVRKECEREFIFCSDSQDYPTHGEMDGGGGKNVNFSDNGLRSTIRA